MTNSNIMVIGGGISGIEAALTLGETGYKVILVEKTSSVGGRMAQLDKTFPTMDCSNGISQLDKSNLLDSL